MSIPGGASWPLSVCGGWRSRPRRARCPAAGGRRRASPTTLRFWAMGREGEVVQELLRDFERENPGIRVRVQQIPWSAAHEKLLTAYVGRLDAGPRAARQHLDRRVRRAARRSSRSMPWLVSDGRRRSGATYFPGIWDTNVIDGVTYGVPWYVDTRVLFYRKDLLAQRAGYAAMPRDVGRVARGDGGDQGAWPVRDRYAIFLPLNEWNPLAILGLQAGLAAAGRRRDTRGVPGAGVPAGVRLLPRSVPRRAGAAGREQRDREHLPGVRARLLRHVHHRSRGTSASSTPPPDRSSRTAWGTAPLPGPGRPGIRRLPGGRLEPGALPGIADTRRPRGGWSSSSRGPSSSRASASSPATCRRGGEAWADPELERRPEHRGRSASSSSGSCRRRRSRSGS